MSIEEKTKRHPLDTTEFWGQNTVATDSSTLDNFWNWIEYVTSAHKVSLEKFEDLFKEVEKINFPAILYFSQTSFTLVDSNGKKFIFEKTFSPGLAKYHYCVSEANDQITNSWYFKIEKQTIYLVKKSTKTESSNSSFRYVVEQPLTTAAFTSDKHRAEVTYDKPHNTSLENEISEILAKHFCSKENFNNVLASFKELVSTFKNANWEVSNLIITSTGPDEDVPLLSKIVVIDGVVEKYLFTLKPEPSKTLLSHFTLSKTLNDFMISQT